MANNPIQFQHGMSLPEFLHSFGTEAVMRARWPSGFRCPKCAGDARYWLAMARASSFNAGRAGTRPR